jgi:hypothetical protein
MKLVAALLALLAVTSYRFSHNQTTPGFEYYDPMSVDASTVDDLRHHRVRVVCTVGAGRPELMLQLCRDKGFYGVAFAPDVATAALLKQADRLGLAVVSAPSGTEGNKTTICS